MRKHKVLQGETLYHISMEHGVTADRIWKLPENRHLTEGNRRPDLLFPGDVVHIPDVRSRTESVASGRRHVFRRKTYALKEVRLRLLFEDEPRTDLTCTLTISEVGVPWTESVSATDSGGYVDFQVPSAATQGLLQIDDDESYRIRFNCLDPIEEVSGVQQRLVNLGYPLENSGRMDEETRTALRTFQRDVKIDETGSADPRTLIALEDKYGV